MKGVRFYEEFDNKRKGESRGNIVAVFPENTWLHRDSTGKLHRMFDCIGAVYFHPNSEVAGSNISKGYLQEFCKRVSEERARQVHPKLFWVLDRIGLF